MSFTFALRRTLNTPHFTLDSPVEEQGSNLSFGQGFLVSLAYALVKSFATAPFYALPVRCSLLVRCLSRDDFASLDQLCTIISYQPHLCAGQSTLRSTSRLLQQHS